MKKETAAKTREYYRYDEICSWSVIGGWFVNPDNPRYHVCVCSEAYIHPSVLLGHGVKIESLARIDYDAVVMAGASIGYEAKVGAKAVVGAGATVEIAARVGTCAVVEKWAVVGYGATVRPGAVVRSGAIVGMCAMVKSGTTVEAGAVVKSRVTVWDDPGPWSRAGR